MKTNQNYKRILKKIYALYDSGADFVMTRWLFSWDDNLLPIENINNAQEEQLVLNELKNRKCIDFRIEENPTDCLNQSMQKSPTFADYMMLDKSNPLKGFKKFNSRDDYKISNFIYINPENDKAWVDYDWAVWITDFDYDKFITSCRFFGFDPVNKSTEAMLKMDNLSTPVVTINDIEYRFKTMRHGQNPCNILNHCLDGKSGKDVKLDELNKDFTISNNSNLNKIFQGTVFNQKDGVLKEFVSISAKVIMVRNVKYLNKESVIKIKSYFDKNCI
jgi:hypothetical protein